jgi:hypothetical protein
MDHKAHTTLIMPVFLFIVILSFSFLVFTSSGVIRKASAYTFSGPGFDCPTEDGSCNCPQGYFMEGNPDRNGWPHCTLSTCQNHSDLCTGTVTGPQVPSTAGTSCSYTVPDPPSLVPQVSTLTCWASALTMMLSYRDHFSYSVDSVLKMLGQVYVDKYNNNQGLALDEFIQISNRLGLTGFSESLDPDEIRNMLQSYGPLMIVAADNPKNPSSLHARLIIGINADCNDPTNDNPELIMLDHSNSNNGNPVSQLFDIFNEKFYAPSNGGGIVMHI